jgi:hypothetical protein
MNPSRRPTRLYTSIQVGIASLLGGPLPACWLIAHNAKELGQARQRTTWILCGIVCTLLLLVLVMFILPERFPPYVVPIAYTFALRQSAKITQGGAIAGHRAAGGRIGSWWTVVGVGLVGLALLMFAIFLVFLLFPSPVVKTLNSHLTMRWSERWTAVRSTFGMTSTLPLRATCGLVRSRSPCTV